MCGIAGFIDFSRRASREELEATSQRMACTLVHRGPDAGGVWVDDGAGVALSHRRLSIIDLSPQGNQPMVSHSGRYVVAFNGEIYNFLDLKDQVGAIDGDVRWRGHSDTEVMLAAFDAWGVEGAIRRFVGMFGFALWDREERELYLVRDRLGEKPLYYAVTGRTLLFASELKAMFPHVDFRPEIDVSALTLFVRHSYVPAPFSIYKGVFKLPPGTYLRLGCSGDGFTRASSARPQEYWSAKSAAEKGLSEPFAGTEDDAVGQLDGLLREAIRNQMIADVPLGVFLSGGVDSPTVVSLMQAQSTRPVKTFTIGFHEKVFSEAEVARSVARHLGTDHTELYVTPDQAIEAIPLMPEIYDEPFSDPSNVPTFLLSKLTRRTVSVSLTGDGGDELFAGYNRHFRVGRLWRLLRLFPPSLRRMAARSFLSIAPHRWDPVLDFLQGFQPENRRERVPGERLHKLARVIGAKTPQELYKGLVTHWDDASLIANPQGEPDYVLKDSARWPDFGDFTLTMLYLDLVTYFPDDILVKVDRAGMGVSLETRMPFLDHRVVEFSWRVPLSMKVRDGRGKWILRRLLHRYVPDALVNHPKAGFVIPLSMWLRGPLRDWAESLLAEKKLREDGFFHPGPVRRKWEEHLSGKFNWQFFLWDVLMFQAWLAAHRRRVLAG